jgi:hypothetical protein
MRKGKMRISDCTCMLCGCGLELKIDDVKAGDNTGDCPMCSEPFVLNITKDEMEEFVEAEKLQR